MKKLLTLGILLLSLNCFSSNTAEVDKIIDEEILDVPEKAPEYIGGRDSLISFLRSNINYPSEAKEKEIQGTVYVQFIINKDGSVSDVLIVKEVNPLLDAEALRVVKLMPKWIPGENNGKKVRVRFKLPIGFRL